MKVQRTTHNDSKRYEDWLDCSKKELLAAKLLLSHNETLNLSAFMCHQSAETALKGLLLYSTGIAPDGHNLVYLCRQSIKFLPQAAEWLDACIEMSGYYIQTRYPADFPLELDKAAAEQTVTQLTKMYKIIESFIIKDIFI